jgi:hypothetical protein
MRRFAITAAILLLAGSASSYVPPLSEEPYWTPDAATIARLEAGLKLPAARPGQATYQLAQYDRYYAGVTTPFGRREVHGILIVPPNREDHPKVGIHVTEVKYLPRLWGGGCALVSVRYYVDSDFSGASCAQTEAQAPESQVPHWTPDEQTAARLEVAIQSFLHRTHADLPDLSRYSRYYWGVTVDGSPVILGRIMRLKQEPGMHRASDFDDGPIMFDGGCSNITVAYNVKSASFTRLGCDREHLSLEEINRDKVP